MELNTNTTTSIDDDCAVKIAIRIKPITQLLEPDDGILKIHESKKALLVSDRAFVFDYILGDNVKQQDVYEEIIKPLVDKLIKGFYCTVLAYGQTGSGKTYTMGLHSGGFNGDEAGMVSRALEDIFNKTSQQNDETLSTISVSYIEVYNEKVYDLLSDNFTDPINVKGFKIPSAIKESVTRVNDAKKILIDGNKNRHVRPTKMNANSSRSHGIFTIFLETKTATSVIKSAMHLVDLAGSEGVRRTGHQGIALTEGVHINQGLLSVGKVLQALSNGCKVIPYRDSVLSAVLQDSLNANSYLTLMACVSTVKEDLSETMYTLRFAENAKLLRNNPKVNAIISELKKQNLKTPTKLFNPLSNQLIKRTPLMQKKLFDCKSLTTIKKPQRNTICTPKTMNRYGKYAENNLNHSTLIRRDRLPVNTSLFTVSNNIKPMQNETIDLHDSFNFNASTSTEICPVSSVVKKDNVMINNMSPLFKRMDILETKLQKFCDKFETTTTRKDIDGIKNDLIEFKKQINSDYIDDSNDQENLFKFPNIPKINILPACNNENDLQPLENGRTTILNTQFNNGLHVRRSLRISMKRDTLNVSTIENNSFIPLQKEEVNVKRKVKPSKLAKNKIIESYLNITSETNKKGITKKQYKVAMLDIINNGSSKELQLLPQIGLKTAFQIVMLRTLNGKFKDLKELSKSPVWRGGEKGWSKFEIANNLS